MSLEFEENVTKQTRIYRTLGQGLKILHDHPFAEVDILAVPGLGTNPEECWTWKPDSDANNHLHAADGAPVPSRPTHASIHDFNWLRDPDGLASIFEKSRIMLYDYASAWRGRRKVRATMKSICTWLLDDLREKRKVGNDMARPLIIIGHSMGGIVVAKALCMAKSKREFEPIVNATVGCAFFGVPFKGSDMAKIALLHSSVFGQDAYESLLAFMRTEKNDTLDEVTSDFMEICTRLVPPVDLFCAWEQIPTAMSYSDRLPNLLQQPFLKQGARMVMDFGISAFGASTHFVEKESAELQGAHSVGLTAGHSDLVKFESIDSPKFVPVRIALSKMVREARMNARKRALSSGERLLPQRFINQVRKSLSTVDMREKFQAKVGDRVITSWLEAEPLYQKWLSPGSLKEPQDCYLWMRGGPGLGKTNASLAAIQRLELSASNSTIADAAGIQNQEFLAFFLCDWLPGCCSAEDVLKSLIMQLINQDESLAQHARWFVPNPRYRGPAHFDSGRSAASADASGAKATATVDNLWRCLQDMIEDPAVNSIHVVISNMHCLDSGASTNALLAKLRLTAFEPNPSARKAKWLVTSRDEKHISHYLTAQSISAIDLDNDAEYGGKVKVSRQKHARDAMVQLKSAKNYSPDFAYYVRNFVESQSQDENWIDILFILLHAMPSSNNSLMIRKWLRETGTYNMPKLIDHAWDKVLNHEEDAMLEIEELMHSMTIAYEPPTLAELAVLTQIEDLRRLEELVRMCSPILQMDEMGNKILFTNPEFRDRLSVVLHGDAASASSQRRRYHGLMALRCFKYIKATFNLVDAQQLSPEMSADGNSSAERKVVAATLIRDTDVLVATHEDEDTRERAGTASLASTITCSYPVRYFFQHISEGFPDAVQELCDHDEDFWGGDSIARHGWLRSFATMSGDFNELNTTQMSALHVAAGLGANELVSILVTRFGAGLLSSLNADGMTALHVAAFKNKYDAVDTLIRAGADTESGAGSSGTALHLAALRGNHTVMKLLIEKGSDVNAFSQKIGPVINAAIRSGTVDAVKLIMGGEVHFDVDYTRCDPPLTLSAGISEPGLFRDILQSGKIKWLQNVKLLDQALIAASYSGRHESVCTLLKFEHVYTNNTVEDAILSAALEKNWGCVNELLEYTINDTAKGNRRDVYLDATFYLTATSREEHLDILQKIWEFKRHGVSKDICDFSLYQATVLNKGSTVGWLLNTCGADANALAQWPKSIAVYAADTSATTDFLNPLNAAASSGNVPILAALIEHGAQIDGNRGYALQIAASEGHDDAVNILLEHGAAVNKKALDSEELGFFSSTALQAACDNKRVGVVRILMQHGADPNLGGGVFTNPITAATQKAQHEVLELLVSAPDINVNVVAIGDGSTPLINAAAHMSMESIELLIRHGADIDARNADGDTALIMAAWKGDEACVNLLCDAGADVTYRSPNRGLPLSAAANGLNPSCATVLADKMNTSIDSYKEQVKTNPSKEHLRKALEDLRERDENIEGLKVILAEAQEQLRSSHNDVEFLQHEKQRMLAAQSFQGQTYESAGQMVKAMQNERAELLVQLSAERGQTALANDSVEKVQRLLETERQANAALRKKQELGILQDEVKAAEEALSRETQMNLDLRDEIRDLQEKMRKTEEQSIAAQASLESATQVANLEREIQERLKDDIKILESKYREEVLANVKASEERGGSSPPTSHKSQSDLRPQVIHEESSSYVPQRKGGYANTRLSSNPLNRPVHASFDSSVSPPRSPPANGNNANRSPDTPSGFRTVHGFHGRSGALGGYPAERAGLPLPRSRSDDLYESSIADVQRGNKTDGGHASRSRGPSTVGSSES